MRQDSQAAEVEIDVADGSERVPDEVVQKDIPESLLAHKKMGFHGSKVKKQ